MVLFIRSSDQPCCKFCTRCSFPIRNFGRPYSTAFTESSLEVMKVCNKDSHASFVIYSLIFLKIFLMCIYTVWQILFTWLSIFMVSSKITPRLRTALFGYMSSPFKLIIKSCVRALAKYGEDRIIISVFSCIEFVKVGLHPSLNFRYTFLNWAKAGIISD